MAACPVCGEPYPADANFCRMCGRKRDQVAMSGLIPMAPTAGGAFSSSILPPAPSMVVGSGKSLAPSMASVPASSYRGSYGQAAYGTVPSPAYASFVSAPGVTLSDQNQHLIAGKQLAGRDLSSAHPGDSWDNAGFRYHMGDRYMKDAQGQMHSVAHADAPRGLSSAAHSFASTGYGSQGYAPGRYGAAGPGINDLHAAHVISTPGYHGGPLPPQSAPGTPAMLPPYMHPEASGKAPKRDKKDKKNKKEKDARRKKKGGCCG